VAHAVSRRSAKLSTVADLEIAAEHGRAVVHFSGPPGGPDFQDFDE
jgi:hypothetical protein